MDKNNEFANNEFEEEEAGMIIRADYIEVTTDEEPDEKPEPMPEEKKPFKKIEVNTQADEEEEKDEKGKKKKDPMREILEWVVCIALALVLTVLIKSFLFDFVVVDGPSMNSTLQHGDRLILTKLGYQPERGDIVVLDAHYKAREAYFEGRRETEEGFGAFDEFSAVYLQRGRAKSLGIDKKYYVKRIIALEGDTIDIDPFAGTVSVNGEVIDEPYLDDDITTPFGYGMEYPYTVEEGHVFVMGDNRINSTDSRYDALGAVPVEALSGKVAFRILPLSGFGGLYDYE